MWQLYMTSDTDAPLPIDVVSLTNFGGLLCTSFSALGVSRRLDFLPVQNKNVTVVNKPQFKSYNLTIEILANYSEWDRIYREFVNFLDRNKTKGFRLYYKPNETPDSELRYCVCSIQQSAKIEKMKPITITVYQNSLWIGALKVENVAPQYSAQDNLFAFAEDPDVSGYFAAAFAEDPDISGYYCIPLFKGALSVGTITNNSYNDVPLTIRIYGACVNPVVLIYKHGEDTPFRQIRIFANVADGYYIEIEAGVLQNGVWYVSSNTGEKVDYGVFVDHSLGSPYVFIGNGEYDIRVQDNGNNDVNARIYFCEEYSE